MTTKSMTRIAVVMAAFALFVGCKKEKAETKTNEPQSTPIEGMLHFNSAEEFAETQQKVTSMGEAERRDWERQQGFKSFATKCHELLEDFEAKGINSEEDVYDFVKENSKYFYIHEENGEKYLQNQLENSLYMYYANENQMLQFGNILLKVFENGAIAGTIEQLEDIISVESFEDDNNKSLTYIPLEKQNVFSDYHTDKGRDIVDSIWMDANTNSTKSYISQRIKTGIIANANRQVTKVYYEMYAYNATQIGEAILYNYHWHIIGSIKPWHRIAGIWFPCQRTKTYDIETKWRYDGISTNDGFGHSSEYNGIGGYEKVFLNRDYSEQKTDFRFTKFSGWSSTPDTPIIIFPL